MQCNKPASLAIILFLAVLCIRLDVKVKVTIFDPINGVSDLIKQFDKL